MPNNFKNNQIVCIEKENNSLYAEIIQVISQRQTCWLRPLILIKLISEEEGKVIDVRETSDLILPELLLKFALDTEVIPLLIELEKIEKKPENSTVKKQILNDFIKEICSPLYRKIT